MILQVALGLSIGVAEYARIREAYRSLPRFSYTMTVTTERGAKIEEYDVNFIRGVGLRVHRDNGKRRWPPATTYWKGANGGFLWIQNDEKSFDSPQGRQGRKSYVVQLRAHPDPDASPFDRNAIPPPDGGPPVAFLLGSSVQWWELQSEFPQRFEVPPEVRIEGKPYRKLVLYDEYRTRTTLVYERDRRLLREIKQERLTDGFYLPVRKVTFRYKDPKRLTAQDVGHPGTMRSFPKLSVKPMSVPLPDRPAPNRGTTVEEVEDALRSRYRELETLRMTIAPAPGTFATSPFRMTMAKDRLAEATCMVRRGRFETIAWMRKGMASAGDLWHVGAFRGRVLAKMEENFFPHDATPVGLSFIDAIWYGLEISLDRQGWQLRSDRWNERPMQVLHRIAYRNLRPGSHVSRPEDYVVAGNEEIWIDTETGLIVRSRRFCTPEQQKEGFDIYDAIHKVETNVRLSPNDLEFQPTPVDLLRLRERELKEGGGRRSDEMF